MAQQRATPTPTRTATIRMVTTDVETATPTEDSSSLASAFSPTVGESVPTVGESVGAGTGVGEGVTDGEQSCASSTSAVGMIQCLGELIHKRTKKSFFYLHSQYSQQGPGSNKHAGNSHWPRSNPRHESRGSWLQLVVATKILQVHQHQQH